MNDILQIANYVQQQGELGRKQGMQNRLQELAPKALAGDYNATAQAYALDPQTAQAYEKGADRIGTQVYNVASAIKRYMGSGQEASAQKIYEQFAGSPAVQARFPGMSPLWNRNEVMPVVDSIMAQTAGSQSSSGNPTGYREFEMTAQAAGLQPGTPEYQEAAKIKLGAVGRAATGGFGFTEIVGADGRKRLARQNPRTGAVEVYDESTGDFSPLGGGGALNPGAPTQAAPVVPAQAGGNASIAIEGVPQEQQQRMANVVSMMQQSGYPAEQIDSWVASQLSQPRAASPQQFSQVAVTPTANPGLGVSRSPEEQAALTTAAQEQAKNAADLANYDAMTGKIANREAATTAAKAGAEALAAQQYGTTESRKAVQEAKAKLPQLNNTIRGIDRIETALKALNGGLMDTGPLDQFAQRYTKEGRELQASVGAIQNSMLALTRVPGVGSQSDLEQRVAMLQYPSLDMPPEVNQRTMQNLRAFAQDLKAAYDNATRAPAAASARPAAQEPSQSISTVPAAGTVQDGYRFRGGNPADPNAWERI